MATHYPELVESRPLADVSPVASLLRTGVLNERATHDRHGRRGAGAACSSPPPSSRMSSRPSGPVSVLGLADRRGRAQLLMLSAGRWRVTIGRDPAADIPLAWDAEVSRTHALLEQVGRGWMLVDDGLSRNGSFVNGARVTGRRRLRDKDRLVCGNTPLTYRETRAGLPRPPRRSTRRRRSRSRRCSARS